MRPSPTRSSLQFWVLLAGFAVTLAAYWPGLSGGFLFDDYPNIVENHGVQPHDASLSSLVNAALSSPASDFKRPLASLSFAMNYLATGLDPYWMKMTNLVIHLLNGLLVFLLARALLQVATRNKALAFAIAFPSEEASVAREKQSIESNSAPIFAETTHDAAAQRIGMVAAAIAASWMLLPINLTGVLYVVQRMESMANLFVLLGLLGYVAGRRRMLDPTSDADTAHHPSRQRVTKVTRGFILCLISLTVPTAVGVLAKETAVMLPLYAVLVEWILFGFRLQQNTSTFPSRVESVSPRRDRRVIGLFLLVLVLPMILGLAWLLPGVLKAETWASRDFTLTSRLLSEARIVVDYIEWTLLPTPDALSFYHDDFRVSTGLLGPWSTLVSIVFLAALIVLMAWLLRRQPLASLGIALFLGCQLLTGTILPLELIYEHRNYFASFGLLLAILPLLAAPSSHRAGGTSQPTSKQRLPESIARTPANLVATEAAPVGALPMALPRYVLLAGLMLSWTVLTALTAYAWGNPLRLAEDLASRAPQSPRAQYELGRTYIIYSHYDPASPFTQLAYAPLEKAAALPDASILPEQALIFMNARMHLPLKDTWWNSMIAKLKARKPGVQDESSLGALTQCAHEHQCDLPKDRMIEAFMAALGHPEPSARLLATYGDYAWNVLDDHALGERMTREAIKVSPDEPAYQITFIRMLASQGRKAEADQALRKLAALNIGGRLDKDLSSLAALPSLR